MANEVTVQGQHEVDPFQQYADEVAYRQHIEGDMLRFSKHGEYKAGQDQEEIPEGTRMLVYMPGMKRGWVKWQDGAPVQHVIGLVADGYQPPNRSELGDLDEETWGELNGRPIDPWQKTNYLVMCDEEGQIYTFVTSSKGGLSAVGALADSYAKRRRMKPDEIPVIELQARSYNHKDFGETFAPVLHITGWAKIPDTFDDIKASIDGGGDDQPSLEFKAVAPAKQPVKQVTKTSPSKPAPKKNAGKKSVRF